VLAACVTPRVQPTLTESQAPALEQGAAVMEDGTRLPLRSWLPAGPPRAAIVAVHGLNDYSGGFDVTATFLSARGFLVYAFDQRGFGRAPLSGIWAGGDRMADDTWQVARLLRERHPDIPLYALGESMGGAVLLNALKRHPAGWIDAVALSAPAVWGRGEMRRYQRMPLNALAHTWRGLKLSGAITGRKPSDDPAALRRLRDDPLVMHKTRVDVLWGIADLMDAVTLEPLAPRVPVLVLYGAHDQIVPAQPMCAWLGTLRGDEWQPALYPSGWHLLTRDLDAARVLADLAAWFERPGAGLPSGADTGEPVERVCALAGVAPAPPPQAPKIAAASARDLAPDWLPKMESPARGGAFGSSVRARALTSCRPCRHGRAAQPTLSLASEPRRSSPRSSARDRRRTRRSATQDA
jgi:alpha-beta hydrolase superfamily lysophospholipase